MAEKTISVAEAAARLGCGEQTVRRAITRGSLRATARRSVAMPLRIVVASVEAYEAARAVVSGKDAAANQGEQ